MKKIIGIILLIALGILGSIVIETGNKRNDVSLTNFNVSNNKLNFRVNVSSSSGYVRHFKLKEEGSNYYITFYSTFGFNNKLGSKDTFEIELDSKIDKIYFYTSNNRYKLVLVKNNNKWQLASNNDYENARLFELNYV